jgi:hypothetical protein
VGPIVEALTETGRGELAEQWLTAALLTAMEREDRAADGSEEQLDASDVVDEVVLRRRDVRADLGRTPDEYDALAEDLDAAPDMVFFPHSAFSQLLAAQPAMATEIGRDWDTHRALIEGELQDADADGEALDVEVATPGMLAALLADAPDADLAPGPRLVWPPGRNDPCWCGSRTKYKKCCLPRGRDRPAAEDGPAGTESPDTDAPPTAPAEPSPAPAPASSERVISRRPGPRTRAR